MPYPLRRRLFFCQNSTHHIFYYKLIITIAPIAIVIPITHFKVINRYEKYILDIINKTKKIEQKKILINNKKQKKKNILEQFFVLKCLIISYSQYL